MGWLGKLFASDELVDSAVSGVDKVIFTQEEKADYLLQFLKAYEPFKIAQRFLALMVGIPYVALWVLSALMLIGSIFFTDLYWQDKLLNMSVTLAEKNNETLGNPFAIILAFYFGGGMLEGAIRATGRKPS